MNKPPKLSVPVGELHGIGIKLEQKLQRLGIYTVQDLLFLLPYRYIDRTRLTSIGALLPGQAALTQGTIELTQVKFGRRRSLLCRISDGTGALILRFFHFSKQQQANLAKGAYIRCWGTPRKGTVSMEMVHPEYQKITEDKLDVVEQTLTPVYPSTEGLTQGRLRRLTGQALLTLETDPENLSELLPEEILSDFTLPELSEALIYVHRPPQDADTESLMAGLHPAQQRLAFEELLAHHLSLQSLRKQIHSHKAALLTLPAKRKQEFIKQLPFDLTKAQKRVLHDIEADVAKQIPMLRLVQGDVGSGKTVIAAIAALYAINSGFQAALMAPTEILAEQHYSTLKKWFADFSISVSLLTGKLKRSEKKDRLTEIAAKHPVIIVGTHALFQEHVVFGRLGLIIVDEQHRFGVHQRLSLLEKGASLATFPHQLIMTATPIPRTITMTVFADLDISIIDEMPPGRKPVNTVVLSNDKRPELIEKIDSLCNQGRQVYWICTLIDESDVIQSQAATDTYENLSRRLPELRVGLIHGKMKSVEKDRIMSEYKSGDINLLVATTVIEVGVDVPSASLMVIENAERLGLSQLHQLRGRVGRGKQQSDCILLYQSPLTGLAKTRLEILRATNDGFEIAKKDMELRGPGEILGTRQTGLPEMRVADLMRDSGLIPNVQRAAITLQEKFPDKVKMLISRWLTDKHNFGNV